MAKLTDLQKQQLIQREPNKSAEYILGCIQKFENLSLDDFKGMDPAKKKRIHDLINNVPNPAEQAEWSKIMAMGDTPSQELLDALNKYIMNWESSRPMGNHVDEAWSKVNSMPNLDEQAEWARIEAMGNNSSQNLLNALNTYIKNWASSRPKGNHVDEAKNRLSAIETADWNNVDTLDINSLLEYLGKYPDTVHKEEIDSSVWALVDKENVQDIQNYLAHFPKGSGSTEAKALLNAIVEWENVKNSNDILIVHKYMRENPSSPFRNKAAIVLSGLKQGELSEMLRNPNGYELSRVMNFLDLGIFSENDLIRARVVTPNILEIMNNPNTAADLPDIRKAIESSYPECKEGYTDVFFFGIPSTGKTCVLMGISRSDSLRINLASGGGEYASALQQYTDVGVTVPRTPGTFVTTLEATISNRKEPNAVHRLNLIEMSGEEFAFQIAGNTDHVFTFEDMGTGATALLNNDNRKVFFLVIDPTANVVRINREIVDGYDEETGDPIKRLEYCVVNQRTIIQKMVNLFETPGNRDIMRKVDSIHIIMTKSDTLGNPVEREEKALAIFNQKFSGDILDALIDVCETYNINSNTQFCPKLYTFSLGTFYLGGYYEYEPTDSNRLVQAIRNSTAGMKKATLWDKIKRMVN